MARFYIETYGCEMNKSDSIDIDLAFEHRGYKPAEKPEDADVVVINTCAVRHNAEERIQGRIGYYKSLKKRINKKQTLVVTGCMAQEWGKSLIEKYDNIDIVTGTYHTLDIPDLVLKYQYSREKLVKIDKDSYEFSGFKGERALGFSAWVNIIKGCSNFCSYCIVPYLRGPEQSKPHEEVIDEVTRLVNNGVVEITLLGQNVNAYGKDNGDISFIELLEKLNKIEGLKWIRFLTSHPKDFDVEDIRRIASLDKVCKQFHLPMQSGSDRILSMMNRRYTIKDYLRLIDAIKKYNEKYSITTDILVGFPDETEEDFQHTLDIVKKVEFDDAFMYRYSDRPLTKASKMGNKVDKEIAKKRLEELIDIQRKISYKKNKMEIGDTIEALIYRKSKKNKDEYLCKTATGKMVVVETKKPEGSFIEILISGISGNTLRGREISIKEELRI